MENSSIPCLLGAIAGDIIGSTYEFNAPGHPDFVLFPPGSHFTDDTVLTLAVADAILQGGRYCQCIQEYARAYPHKNYGGNFRRWIYSEDPQPYHSYGNGSAMRVSAVGWAFDNVPDVLHEARSSAAVTHDHPEGIKGAQAVALALFLARTGLAKDEIRAELIERFGYDLSRTLDEIRPSYRFDETCQGTVPPAIIAFLESQDYEDAVRKAVSLGGDADTLAAITGSIAEAFYGGIPQEMFSEVRDRLPDRLWDVIERFNRSLDHF